ncbi:DUF4166 domain-containing protein [Streptosporangium carneum]|uniref:DUF4166 domain-containing protein n=1 Tax=Streptosporangium carneum TaxID=47481 RepID=A0A9W6I6Q9_9ACTN|nr:DUF4166 domain-containing protein [Streptosporangium carneum]GLK13095.1 hypothetical protein GCM10017600_65060 [Streptosporangium carneum]
MTSIFQRALGSDFARLHPQLQRRFSVGVDSGRGCVGSGVMERIWHGGAFVRPFLLVGGRRNVLLPRTGRDVPFTIENYPYLDSYGRETVTFVRTFEMAGGPRRFDATMIYDSGSGRVVDYLGSHQHIATGLEFEVDDRGALVIRSGGQRFLEGPLNCRIPPVVSGTAVVRESYDDEAERFRIAVTVSNHRFGPLFGYWGSFTARYVDVAGTAVPANVKPRREEARH